MVKRGKTNLKKMVLPVPADREMIASLAKPKQTKKSFIWLGLFIVILAILAVFGWLFYQNQNRGDKYAGIGCHDGLLAVGGKAIERDDLNALSSVAEEILTRKDFDKSQDCLYVVLHYYLKGSDSEGARLYYEKLVKIYDKKKGFNAKYFGANPTTLEEFKDQVEAAEQARRLSVPPKGLE